MDRKSSIVLIISFVLMLLWFQLVAYMYPPPKRPISTNQVSTVTSTLSNVVAAAATISTNAVSAPEERIRVTNDLAIYTFTSVGGGLQQIELRKYPQVIDCGPGRKTNEGNFAILNAGSVRPVLSFPPEHILAGDQAFQLTRIARGVRAEKSLGNGLHLVKEFLPLTNYLVEATVRFENRGTDPVKLPELQWVAGTASAATTNDAPPTVGVFWFDGDKNHTLDESFFANKTLGCFDGTPRTEFLSPTEKPSNIVWTATHNQFFAIATMPFKPAAQTKVTRHLGTNLATQTPQHYQAVQIFPATVIPAGHSFEQQFNIFAGPREYQTLERLGDVMKNKLELVMNFGFFGWFAKFLLVSMNGLHALGLEYGLAIIAITVIIKILFWPLTTASARSAKRMAALQPQLKAIQEKYKDDPRKVQSKMQEMWKANGVNPLSGCIPILLQAPILFGFYTMIQSSIELRGAQFLWACDLSRPDTVANVFGFPLNIMPLLWFVTMLWQARLMPLSPGMDPAQQKIMQYMPLIFIGFLYNMSSGLTLYWTVQNLLSIAQTKLTKANEPLPGTVPPPAAPKKAVTSWSQKKRKS